MSDWTFPYVNVLCEAQCVVWLECEEFCSKTVDWPQINTGGQSTLNLEVVISQVGREGRRGGSIDTQLGSCHFLGGEGGSINTQLGKDPQRL